MTYAEPWLFMLAVLLNAVNLFLQIFFILMYTDLVKYDLLTFEIVAFSNRVYSRFVEHQ